MRETLAKTGAVPMMDFDREGAMEIPVLQKGAVYSEPAAMSNNDYNPFREEYIDPTAPDPNVDFTGFDVPYTDPGAAAHAAPRSVRTPSFPRGGALAASESDEFEDFASGGGFGIPGDGAEFGESSLDFIPSSAELEQRTLDLAHRAEFSDALPLPGGYVAALLGGRFVVVDVRRARERILYEDYLRMLGHGSAVSQQLLFPERLVLSGDEYALLEEHAVEFASLGFDIELCGGGAVEVKGTPADMPADTVDQLLFDLLQAFATPVSLADVRREKIASVMALSGAKGVVRNLSREEAAALLERLAETGNISFSPSGKTILAEFTAEDLRAKLG